MRVKIAYSVDEENVLAEAANLIGLLTPDVKKILDLFNEVQTELRGAEESPANLHKAVSLIGNFRTALLNVDTRLDECTQIIMEWNAYLAKTPEAAELASESPESPNG